MVDLSTGAPGDSPATLSRYGQMIQSFDEYDQIDHEFSNQGDYDDWTHHVKYLYQERDGGYDGLGRLIKKNYRLGVAGESSALGFANYIYDGARRVQEILRYPVAAAALLWPAAADRPPLHAHAECAAGGGCPPGYATQHVIEHEYVWSPDGGDSIVAAITPDDLYGFDDDGPPAGAGLPSVAGSGDDDVYYMLQDDNGNVMSVVDDAGAVRVQYQYDPYGELVIRDVPLPGSLPLPGPTAKSPLFSVGFQGLFFERFYGLLVESAGGGQPSNAADPPLDVPAPVSAAGGNGGSGGVGSASQSTQVRGLYYMRNRWYSAHDGRFTSRDPNEAGMPIIAALAANGETLGVALNGFSGMGHYADGLNLYSFVHGNPVNRVDPMGLDDPFAEVDAWTNDRVGHALAQLGALNEKALGFAAAARIAVSLLPGGGILDALEAGGNIYRGKGGFMDFLAVATIASPAVFHAFKWAGKITNLLPSSWFGWLRRGAAAACKIACFTAGANIATPTGLLQIHEIDVGTIVLTRPESDAGESVCEMPVTATFFRIAPVVARVAFDDGSQVEATPEHPFWNLTTANWVALEECAVGDQVISMIGDPRTITSIEFMAEPTPVFNFEVEPTHTYFANGIWVHNCIGQIGKYKDMKKLTAGAGGDIQAYHILEARHARNWGIDPEEVSAVILKRKDHQAATNALRTALPYGKTHTKKEVLAAYKKVYAGHDDWLAAIAKHFK